LLVAMVAMGLLGALITFAGQPLYAPHLLTTEVWGLDPLEDQQTAGLITNPYTKKPLSRSALARHFKHELEHGEEELLNDVAGTLAVAAKRGNIAACIFIAKTRGRWKETSAVEVSGPGGKPVETRSVVVLPPIVDEDDP